MNKRVKVSLVEGDSRVRAAICHLLSNAEYQIEPFENLGELFACDRDAISLLVRDEDSAISAIFDHMVRSGSWMPVIAFADNFNHRRVLDAGRLGAGDYLTWPFNLADIADSIVRAGRPPPALVASKYREVSAQERLTCLSGREREVLAWVARGLRNREIGERLCISARTVERHRANLVEKLGVGSSSDAIRIASEAMILDEVA